MNLGIAVAAVYISVVEQLGRVGIGFGGEFGLGGEPLQLVNIGPLVGLVQGLLSLQVACGEVRLVGDVGIVGQQGIGLFEEGQRGGHIGFARLGQREAAVVIGLAEHLP